MKKMLAVALPMMGLPLIAFAQHEGHMPVSENPILNIIEVITGLAAAVVAFQAALAYREGKLGKGVAWVTVGMVIMSVHHFILVAKRFLHFDPLSFLGETGGTIAFS